MSRASMRLGIALRVVGEVALLIVVAFAVLTSVVLSWVGYAAVDDPGPLDSLVLLAALVAGIAAVVAVGFRARAPWWITVALAAASIVLPIGPVPALSALVALVRRRQGWRPQAGIGVVALVLGIGALRDVLAPNRGSSVLQSLAAASGTPTWERVDVPLWLSFAAVIVPLCLAVGAGLLLRLQHSQHLDAQRRDSLTQELARSEERARIAREIHDVLGHRLSLISLQAGALEARASAHPEFADAVIALRELAARSMDDLRVILDVVGADEPQPRLSELGEIAVEWASKDVQLFSTVYLDQADSAPPEVARAVLRVVQESLTNARRHAPGAPVKLSVMGSPERGIDIEVRNHVTEPDAEGRTGGLGLVGMEERVNALGGEFSAGPVGDEYVLRVHIPWAARRR